MSRPATPTYGRDLLATLDRTLFADCVVFCAPEAWELVRDKFPVEPKKVVVPESMEQSAIEEKINAMPRTEAVFGVGGGSACDAAKMYAWLTGARLVLVPSILSVDAPFTKEIGVRVNHRVRYVGSVVPEYLLIDFDILQRAPKRLNRAGVGDILSIYTALWDWRLAADVKGERYDERIARRAQALFDRMVDGAREIRDCTEKGLRLIAELYVGEVALCAEFGNSRPEEGSEHYFAYCLEFITRRAYIHGELIAFAVVLTSLYQGQNVDDLIGLLDEIGVEYRPANIGILADEIEQTLLTLPRYVEEESQLLYGVYHRKGVNPSQAKDLIGRLRKMGIIQ